MLARPSVECVDRGDAVVLCFDAVGMVVEEQVNVLFGAYEPFFLRVTKLFVSARRFRCVIAELFDDLTDSWLLSAANISHRPDANFAGTVAAEHRSVLHESDFAAHSRG